MQRFAWCLCRRGCVSMSSSSLCTAQEKRSSTEGWEEHCDWCQVHSYNRKHELYFGVLGFLLYSPHLTLWQRWSIQSIFFFPCCSWHFFIFPPLFWHLSEIIYVLEASCHCLDPQTAEKIPWKGRKTLVIFHLFFYAVLLDLHSINCSNLFFSFPCQI